MNRPSVDQEVPSASASLAGGVPPVSATGFSEGQTSGPTSLTTGRSLAPDLARGWMLLFIAIANAPWYLYALPERALSQHPDHGGALDRVVQTISLVVIDARSYPMFAFLFGYGIWQVYRRQAERNVPHRQARRLLYRRQWWLLAFGFAHAALLWIGDVLGAYAVVGLLVVWLFLDRKDRTLKVWAIVLAAAFTAFSVLMLAGSILVARSGGSAGVDTPAGVSFPTGNAQENYLVSAGERVTGWLISTPMQAIFGLVIPTVVLLAIVAARRGILERPAQHRPLLRRVAVIGIVIGWIGGAVTAVQNLGLLGLPTEADWGFSLWQMATGMAAGLGYVAFFALIAARYEERRAARGAAGHGSVVGALTAVGKRSLTRYLLQSVLMAPVLAAWGLGLGGHLTSWSVTAYAIGVWLVTVALAVWMERKGWRGPAESVLRRLVYGRR